MGWPSPSMHLPLLSPSLFSTLSLSPARARRSWRLHFAAAAAADGELQRRRPEGLSRRAEARRRSSDFDPRFFLFSSRRVKKKTGFIFFFFATSGGSLSPRPPCCFCPRSAETPVCISISIRKTLLSSARVSSFFVTVSIVTFCKRVFFCFCLSLFFKTEEPAAPRPPLPPRRRRRRQRPSIPPGPALSEQHQDGDAVSLPPSPL